MAGPRDAGAEALQTGLLVYLFLQGPAWLIVAVVVLIGRLLMAP